MKRGAGKRCACSVRHHRSRSDNWRRGGRASHVSWLLQAEALQRARADEEAVAVGENALHTARPFGSVDKKPLSTLLKNRRRSHAWQSGSDRRFCERLPCLTCWHAPDTCPATVLCSFFCYIKMQAAAMMRRQEERLAKTGKTTACCDPLLLRQFGRCACLVQAVTAYSRSKPRQSAFSWPVDQPQSPQASGERWCARWGGESAE